MNRYVPLVLLAISATTSGCINADYEQSNSGKGGDKTSSVNSSITVRAGQQPSSASTVNGSIHIEDSAVLKDAETVNGDIQVGARATAESLETVNGSITLNDGVKVARSVTAVNGSLTLNKGVDVGGELTNVNGHIRLKSAHVGKGIRTVSGDIDIGPNSKVDGGLKVERGSSSPIRFGKSRFPRIVIGPGAVVNGPLTFERKVELYVSDSATIGPVKGATAVKFTGDAPPG